MKYTLSDNTWDENEIRAINEVIDSGFFSMGDKVKAFENQFAKKVGSKYAIMSNSGSSANLLAIAALVYSNRLKTGDEVIVPAVSWSTTYFPLYQHNLKLKFVDIDLNTFNLDVDKCEEAITDKTKAILAVNLLGNPNKFDALNKLCEKHNLLLVEDNCESLGAIYKDKALGTIGLLGTYSTFYSHHICTMEGGLTVTDDEELYHYMLSIRSHGWTRHLPDDSKIYQKSGDSFYESFNFIMPGYNLRPIEMEGAVGIEQLKKLDNIIEQRRDNAKYFQEGMAGIGGDRIQKEVEKSSWFGFAIIMDDFNKGKRNDLLKLFDKYQIDVRPIVTGNFCRNKAIRYMNYEIHDSLDNADIIHDEGFFVGNHSKKNHDKIELLFNVLKEFNAKG
jgi:CDP-6-deoxy-D-xylo-4-hexulose-3-dehydrase